MKALVIEHDDLSRPERVGTHLESKGFELDLFIVVEDINNPEVTAEFPDDPYDAVVLMGAPWSVYDPRLKGWVMPELALIREHLRRRSPILGICFGAQAVSAATGGTVSRSGRPEYGWSHISSSTEGISDGPWFQFHHDEFTLPDGAITHAKSDSGIQAYQLDKSLCVQFHPEVTAELIAAWCDAGGADELLANGYDPDRIVEDTRVKAPATQEDLETMLDWWLDGMGG